MTSETVQREQLTAWLHARAPSTPIAFVETHISILAFQGDRVYKLKKGVRFGFIDLSTRALRLADCEREVALNRRLAPDVYLGVEAMTDGDGSVIDHVVVMRRMPEAQRLASLVSRGDDAIPCIDRVAALLARFHDRAPTGGPIDAAATRDTVARLWKREISEFPAWPDDLAALVERYLEGRAELFEARIAAGRARDGHGDLLADDIFCLADGPRVLDCLEFDEQLRFGDVLADVAFLAMDLERLGRPDLGERFLDRYRAATGDQWPTSLAHFYIAYRAHVRAKVAVIKGNDDEMRSRLAFARDHLERGRIRVVLVGGPPATGKTTLARLIADTTGWPVVRSDEVRKELAGIDRQSNSAAALDEGIYTAAWTARTYGTLCDRARKLLTHGSSVVLDASWSDRQWREMVARMADETASDLVALHCEAPVDVARARARRRTRAEADASDADATIAAAAAARFTPRPEARRIETTNPVEEVRRAALLELGRY